MLREQKKVVGIEDYYGAEDAKGKKAEEKIAAPPGAATINEDFLGAVRPDGTTISGCIDFILCRRDEHTGNQSNTTDE